MKQLNEYSRAVVIRYQTSNSRIDRRGLVSLKSGQKDIYGPQFLPETTLPLSLLSQG